ncbi:hypothetical protein [Paenibacillus sp. An7]|uniref:hypothetical protein n=1 Tax=Paenibacillus sp. An7 TaxID=2689577 RepID=UPI00135B9784|nr:hypothetical protein [Paenibacillus sp. An7]
MSAATIISAIVVIAQILVNSIISYNFSKKLDNHRSQLQSSMEAYKFDIQRKMQDFSLYTTKKHEAYSSLYRLFLEADNHIGRIMGGKHRQADDYMVYTIDEITKLLDKYEIKMSRQKIILDNWNRRHEDPSVLKNLQNLMNRVYNDQARDYQRRAHNEYFFNKLYLSKEVNRICEDLSSELGFICVNIDALNNGNEVQWVQNKAEENIFKSNSKINNLFKELNLTMQEELKVGYYADE